MTRQSRLLVAVVTLSSMHPLARADEAKIDKSGFTLFAPTPDAALRDFTPDRPARASTPITVDAGHFQIESDFLSASVARQDGMTTRTIQAADPVLKIGLTDTVEFDVALGGFNDMRVTDDASHSVLSHDRGFGDVTLSTKINMLGNNGGDVAFALVPYLVVPSGVRNISAGQVEGGVLAPVVVKLPSDFSLELQGEVDVLANENGPGTHVNVTDILNVSHPIPGIKDLTGIAEFYSSLSLEPHTPDVYTFDMALAYLVDKSIQLDVGANLGLNRAAPGFQVYSGVAHRF